MIKFRYLNQDLRKQFVISVLTTLFVALGCFLISDLIGYRVVALLLLVTVSINSIFLDIKPVLTAAILSALIWNFFFIPPRFTLAIHNAEDVLMFLMYFIVALINGVFTTRIRKAEQAASMERERENTIRLYNTLLNSLSHELRTPISTIVGASDNLLSMADKLSEHNKFELANEISKASLQLNRQVENLLNMSRLESGYLKPKNDWVDMKELVNDVINHLDSMLNGKPVNTHFSDKLPLFKLDYGLMFQVIHNLIHNAILYIPKYAVMSVYVNSSPTHVTILVEDTGNGFPEDEINRVFDKFYRLKNTATGGTGLGLSIVKGFVEAMGGTITLENMPSAGARFTIVIPCEVSTLNADKI